MFNVFELQPEWIERDDRQKRPVVIDSPGKNDVSLSYKIDGQFMFDRHRIMLPSTLIKNKRILDIGSCIGATGAWCLSNGASHYTGIECLKRYVDISQELFKKYYHADQYNIIGKSFYEHTFEETYDIVVASGVLYAIFNSFNFIEKVSKLSKNIVIFDTIHPFNGYRRLFPKASAEDRKKISKILNIIQPTEKMRMQSNISLLPNIIKASFVSLPALILLMKYNDFKYDCELFDQAELHIPQYYNLSNHNRYMAKFYK